MECQNKKMSKCLDDIENVVLCSNYLGGAEIFILERIIKKKHLYKLYANEKLTECIIKDERYAGINIIKASCMDKLANKINIINIVKAGNYFNSMLKNEKILLANLRSSTIGIIANRSINVSFVHDNTNYLNYKAKLLIFLIVLFSEKHISHAIMQ